MNTKDWFENKLEELKDDFEFRLEGFILHLTEDICKRMMQKDMNRTDLAQRLDVSRPAVTKILNGSSNFTLRTLLSIADALEYELDINFVEKNSYGYVCSANEVMAITGADSFDGRLLDVDIGKAWSSTTLGVATPKAPDSTKQPIWVAA